MWTPSIYAGVVVGLAFVCRLLNPRRYFGDPWLALAVTSLLLCFGHFGLVWVLQQIPGVLPESDSAIGGPYWFLVEVVPGYSSFRYPVKWLPMFAIAAAMITAKWMSEPASKRERGVVVGLILVLICGALAAHWMVANGAGWIAGQKIRLPVDEYWGPMDLKHGFTLIRASCLWSIAMLIVVGSLRCGWFNRVTSTSSQRSVWPMVAWLSVIALDCVLNASTLLPAVDIDQELQLSHQASPPPIASVRTLRTQAGYWPEAWRNTHSPNRALEVAASERIAWFGRWHLAKRRPVFNSMVSIRSGTYAGFWQACNRQVASMDRTERNEFWVAIRRWLGIGAISHVDESRSIAAGGLTLVDVVRKMSEPVAAIRVQTDWRSEKPLAEIVDNLASGLGTDERGILLPHVAILRPEQGDDKLSRADAGNQWAVEPDGSITIKCAQVCLLERCVYQDGNWHATLESAETSRPEELVVFRSSHLNQAVRIPAGTWRVRFEYRPRWIWPTVLVAGLSAIALLFLLILPPGLRRAALLGNCVFSKPR
ncbi:MAG: hypothetical protein KDB00_30365, partial [Planctomycetales bacterium]|nr:hypothetical protein [Planctomycetales bacterium]